MPSGEESRKQWLLLHVDGFSLPSARGPTSMELSPPLFTVLSALPVYRIVNQSFKEKSGKMMDLDLPFWKIKGRDDNFHLLFGRGSSLGSVPAVTKSCQS